MRKYRFLALFVLAAVFLTACGGKENEKKTGLRLWYIQGDPGSASVVEAAKAYNADTDKNSAELVTHGFEGEAELAEAFNSLRPELVYCSFSQAQQMYESGMLVPFASADESSILTDELTAGGYFIPYGADIQLMALKGGTEAPKDSLEAICAYAAEKGRFISVESYAGLFSVLLSRYDAVFTGERSLDVKNPDYVYVYNLLAETAYSGGIGGENAPCRFAYSSSLAKTGDNDELCPLPLSENAYRFYAAECYGFVCPGTSAKKISAFMSFFTENGSAGALKAGLMPLRDFIPGDDALSRVLYDVYNRFELIPTDRRSTWQSDRKAFDETIRVSFTALAS